jgi:hydroxymethylpyrimidine pyrophosphatase-like HAD family hydrolase
MQIKGTLGLDIDGTLTNEHHVLPELVVSFLTELYHQGWCLVFITGREYVYAMQALCAFDVPFYLAVQNGADLIKMPEKLHIKSFYMDNFIIKDLQPLFEKANLDFLLYSGFEKGDFCYFRPSKHKPDILELLKAMEKRSAKPWRVVQDFSIEHQHAFPLIKALGFENDFVGLKPYVINNHPLNFVSIKNPKAPDYSFLLITHKLATKKEALQYFMENFDLPRPLIVAGDDQNDKESLEFADVKVVMDNAPINLKSFADVLAPLSTKHGIIPGLKQALKLVCKKGFREWD